MEHRTVANFERVTVSVTDASVRGDSRIANEEVFGPVLAVIRAKDLDEALAIANSTAYKLTGGIFSRKPSSLERAKREFRVGNLYLNRGSTGALVERQQAFVSKTEDFIRKNIAGQKTKQAQSRRKMLDKLDKRARYAVEARFGLLDGERKSFREVGETLGVTAEAARRLVSRAVASLKDDAPMFLGVG